MLLDSWSTIWRKFAVAKSPSRNWPTKWFSRDFGQQLIALITVEEVDNWLRDLKLSPKSRANYRANIGVLFSYAVNRRMLDSNPVTFTAEPKLPDDPPAIFAVDQSQSLLEAASRVVPHVLPMLALGAFAGFGMQN